MTNIQKKANKEVLVIIDKFDLRERIPSKVIGNLENNKDDEWEFIYDDNLKLEEQKMLRQTAVLISTLYLMYICEDDAEKENLKLIYTQNETKNIGNNSLEDVISKKENMINNEKEELTLVPKKDTFIDKIKKWLKSLKK